MSETTRTGLAVLTAALALGVLGDALLGAAPLGINLILWVGALVVAVALLVRKGYLAPAGDGCWLAMPLLLFAAAVAWRDSRTLRALDTLAVLIAGGLALHYARSGNLRAAGVTDYLVGLALAGAHAVSGVLVLLFGDIRWQELPHRRWSGQVMAVGRGLLLAVPLLLVFGALFMAADAVFDRMVSRWLEGDVLSVFGHLFRAACWAWVTAGLLRGVWLGKVEPPAGSTAPGSAAERAASQGHAVNGAMARAAEQATGEGDASGPVQPGSGREQVISLGMVEVAVALGLLNLLFLAFVGVQFRYFFGGAALVQATTGLTYAEYARRGFFELVTVAALVLPILLVGHWLLRKEHPGHERVFRYLAGMLLALLGVIMVSAVQRMRLYQQEFGLTELRLYTTAFMAWLAFLLLWFGATVLRGRRERFAFGALLSGFVALAALHFLNPDALIVRTNAARLPAGRSFDARYAASLSADAVPALLEALPALPEPERRAVATEVLRRWSPPAQADWRTWNRGRVQAWHLVREHREELEALAGRPEALAERP